MRNNATILENRILELKKQESKLLCDKPPFAEVAKPPFVALGDSPRRSRGTYSGGYNTTKRLICLNYVLFFDELQSTERIAMEARLLQVFATEINQIAFVVQHKELQ
jgi:hypothetical protein